MRPARLRRQQACHSARVDIEAFWDLVEVANKAGSDRTQLLTEALAQRTVAELVEFDLQLERQKQRADTWQMWGAAYAICDSHCSDDGFWYFQSWLIGLGREAFERVVADPDALADVPEVRALAGRPSHEWAEDDWPDWELLDYVAAEAYERITGGDGDDFEDLLSAAGASGQASPEPSGESWDFEDPAENARRLPKVSALFPLSPIEERDARTEAVFADFLAQSGQSEEEFFTALESRVQGGK